MTILVVEVHIFSLMVLTVFCSFCSQGSVKSFIFPQLPYSGRGWTWDPEVPGGREPYRLVKRDENHGLFLQLQRAERGCQSWVPALPPKLGMRFRAESTKPALYQGLPVFSITTAGVFWMHSLGENKVQCSSEAMTWCGRWWWQECDLGSLLTLRLLI